VGNIHAALITLAFSGILLYAPGGRAQMKNLPAELVQAIHQGGIRIVDLTYDLNERAPFWPEGTEPFPFHAKAVATFEREGAFARMLQIPEHFGTHMDAPLHFDPQGESLDQIAVEKFVLPAVVVDVTAAAASSPDYRVTVADLEQWENAHGPMPSGGAVLIHTGWASRWPSQERFMNQDARGVMHFPGLSIEAARYLLDHAHPVCFGIDTPSVDCGSSKDFKVHRLITAAGLYILENLANLHLLPATGVCLIALPMKLQGGTGSPTRVVALVVPQSNITCSGAL
jgi:kynurenine formamidase